MRFTGKSLGYVVERLQWLEEANLFINKTIGFKKRAITDRGLRGWNKRDWVRF